MVKAAVNDSHRTEPSPVAASAHALGRVLGSTWAEISRLLSAALSSESIPGESETVRRMRHARRLTVIETTLKQKLGERHSTLPKKGLGHYLRVSITQPLPLGIASPSVAVDMSTGDVYCAVYPHGPFFGPLRDASRKPVKLAESLLSATAAKQAMMRAAIVTTWLATLAT